MRTLTLLLCLAQLLGCRSVPVGTALAYREPNCDDPETEQAALAAVDYINNRVLRGYKHTLNQIDKVRVWPRVSDCVWSSTGCLQGPLSQHKEPTEGQTLWFLPRSEGGSKGEGEREEAFWAAVMGLRTVLDRGEEMCETRKGFE